MTREEILKELKALNKRQQELLEELEDSTRAIFISLPAQYSPDQIDQFFDVLRNSLTDDKT